MNPQAIIDGLIAGSTIGLGAIGLTLTYSILRFANFTHGDFLAWGAYLTLTVAGVLGGLAAGLGAPVYPFSFGWGLPLAMFGGVR
jgi:branched-chain amino acid transport system permease protein